MSAKPSFAEAKGKISGKFLGFSKRFFSGVKANPFAVLLVLFTLLLSWSNYQPGTWLSGWDTLHPEFNFGLYFKRIFFGVWQEHQGLGAVASQAHSSELPRLLLYYLTSFLLPESILRYSYFFLTLAIGPLGVYFFLKQTIFKKKTILESGSLAFCGALVYLLNLATLQHYYVPLEMFATHFATLPWLLLFSTKHVEDGSKGNLFWFASVSLLSTSIAHTPTLFYVYFVLFATYVLILSLIKGSLKRVGSLILATVIINSFWLLPNVYFVTTKSQEVIGSKIHTQFSETAFLTGKKFGDFANTAIFKNFLFDWGEFDQSKGQFVDLFNEWSPHLNSVPVISIGYLVFALVILGILSNLKNFVARKKNWEYGIALLPIFLISYAAISNNNPLSSTFFLFLEKFPVFKEALRFPFTKFSIILAFCFAVYFSLALSLIIERAGKLFSNQKILHWVQAYGVLILLTIYMLPAIGGNLISPSMKVTFPKEYFQMFSWFDRQPQGRIAPFPIDSYWGWTYQNWHYEGAGFRWFGLKQPILDREFDRWANFNENYYWEISNAVYSNNLKLFEGILDKYQINWLLVDSSVINPSSPKAVYFDKLQNMLSASRKVELVKTFGFLQVYQINLSSSVNSFVFLDNNLTSIEPAYSWNNYDAAYLENGNYISSTDYSLQSTAEYYPFRSLFTGKTQKDLEFTIEDKGDYFSFKRSFLDTNLGGYHLEVPQTERSELVWVDPKNLAKTKNFYPEVNFDGKEVEVRVPKVEGLYSAYINPLEVTSRDSFTSSIWICNVAGQGEVEDKKVTIDGQEYLRLIARDADNCTAGFWLPNFPQEYSYLVSAETRNLSGKSLLFWIENLNSHRPDLETYLPKGKNFKTSYFIQPPMENEGLGYSLHFDNISIGQEETVNDLGEISVYPIPYYFLTSLVLRPNQGVVYFNLPYTTPPIISVEHSNPSLYSVGLEGQLGDNPVLVLSQGYNEGWNAYQGNFQFSIFPPLARLAFGGNFQLLAPLLGKKIEEHVLVNNWENGWRLDKQSLSRSNRDKDVDTDKEIVIVFLPQYLEYFGLLLVVVYFGWLGWRYKHV
ncbi:MAG: hypothetical protein A2694_01375 [Candidatus Blackburnbacteria bacterium RIFCSPHIGHO2_01_FULL_40_17]|uniref:Membrane protein 6-pyruvoyl-tetrahydropterin synthase-related domain-containing protein n=1 Tax=Candidatus Blackburnbacteria bacterium RIFCSPLOWO2_01_FULL_40_20 TaxID=1797519 RepID=A0A1G1VEU7_9BACT|nr:MAG: hypothetical protein A2694_01375 [Candidatus Blackburnbacteria bacterium RIFCSPHIGHO2_01_FULL_40_17]OGY13938.1 MAG: hypothetical protein A3A77_04035 [Candidatus Blackburnbacteria bacterium RIFCSPLOWO2_01_FULL_40_20]